MGSIFHPMEEYFIFIQIQYTMLTYLNRCFRVIICNFCICIVIVGISLWEYSVSCI